MSDRKEIMAMNKPDLRWIMQRLAQDHPDSFHRIRDAYYAEHPTAAAAIQNRWKNPSKHQARLTRNGQQQQQQQQQHQAAALAPSLMPRMPAAGPSAFALAALQGAEEDDEADEAEFLAHGFDTRFHLPGQDKSIFPAFTPGFAPARLPLPPGVASSAVFAAPVPAVSPTVHDNGGDQFVEEGNAVGHDYGGGYSEYMRVEALSVNQGGTLSIDDGGQLANETRSEGHTSQSTFDHLRSPVHHTSQDQKRGFAGWELAAMEAELVAAMGTVIQPEGPTGEKHTRAFGC